MGCAAAGNIRKNSRLIMVKGPLTATMATLRDINIPATPWKWYPTEDLDVDWTYTGADPRPFLREMQQKLSCIVWKQAAQHYNGKRFGKRGGHDVSAQTPQTVGETRSSHQSLYAFASLPPHQFTTPKSFANTTLLKQPRLSVYCVVRPMTRCSIVRVTVLASQHPSSWTKHGKMVEEARGGAHSCPIFWFRSLPPSDWYPELPNTEDSFAEDFGSLKITGGACFQCKDNTSKDPFSRCEICKNLGYRLSRR